MTRPPLHSFWLHDPALREWRLFQNPVAILAADRLADVPPLIAELDRAVNGRGLHAAGFLAYDAAPAFDSALPAQRHPSLPLAWFGLYHAPVTRALPAPGESSAHPDLDWSPGITRDRYNACIRAVRAAIAAGLTYQVNYTLRLHTRGPLEPWPWFLRMIRAQPGGYGAFLQTERFALCSASPELFFELDGRDLASKPMKGTAPRGLGSAEDCRLARDLRLNPKTRAENVMITDMVRHDMGRIAETGSVRVTRLFEVERLPTVLQMTSTVRCKSAAPIPDLFRALFPPASITGAPKASTMRLIADLEDSPRGVYTGAIGFLAPGRRARFNVAIRTVAADLATGAAEYGTGGGIVWDSTDAAEFEECLAKAAILRPAAAPPAFDLLETLRWTPAEGYVLLAGHLDRLRESARYYRFPLRLPEVRAFLEKEATGFPASPRRVRLLVAADGTPRLEHGLLDPLPAPFRTVWSRAPVNPANPLLYHKTTCRALYDEARHAAPDAHDVLLWNTRGEVTESTLANVFVEIGGRLFTPPLEAGLLPGVLRADLLQTGRATERPIRPADVLRAARLFLGNSVRGLWSVTPPAGPAPAP